MFVLGMMVILFKNIQCAVQCLHGEEINQGL